MSRIVKNTGSEKWKLADTNPAVTIPANDQADLNEWLTDDQLSNSNQLVTDLGNPSLGLVLNDGSSDLSAADAIRLILRILPATALDSLNRTIMVPQAQVDGESRIIVSHRWTDPCTWYGDSQRETGFVLTDSGDGLRFTSGKVHWIDLTHGRIFREDRVSAPYLVKVYVDGVEKTERPPFKDVGGDYEVNYELGEVTFFSSQAGKAVTADFSWENGSTFYVRPRSGKKLWVERSEAQFSVDSVMRDTLFYQIELIGAPLGTLAAALGVSVDSLSHVYKTWFDFVEESNGAYPVMPPIGGSTKRGLVNSSVNVPFGFGPAVELKSSDGVEIRIWLQDDIAYDGEAASVTSYCTEYDE